MSGESPLGDNSQSRPNWGKIEIPHYSCGDDTDRAIFPFFCEHLYELYSKKKDLKKVSNFTFIYPVV